MSLQLQVLETAESGDRFSAAFRPGLGTFSGPEAGTSTIEKRQRSIKMKETSTVKLQMELQRYAVCESQKKGVAREFFFVVD